LALSSIKAYAIFNAFSELVADIGFLEIVFRAFFNIIVLFKIYVEILIYHEMSG
jgi:hypothetical protein